MAILLPGDFRWALQNLPPQTLSSVVLLLQSWDPHPLSYFAINAPAWSLSDELFFYACFPCLCRVAKRRPATVTCATFTGLVLYLVGARMICTNGRSVPGLYSVFPLVRLPEFVLGILLCEASRRIPARGGATLLWTGLEVAALALTAVVNMIVMPVHAMLLGHGWEGLASYYAEAGTAPAFALVILVFSMSAGLLNRLLSLRALVYLGEISFAIYMLHQPIERFVDSHRLIANTVLRTAAVAISVMFVAALSFQLIERPINRIARRLLAPARTG